MKSPLLSVGVTAVLAAGLMFSPGLSPASAATVSSPISTSAINSGNIATPTGIWFLPCSMAGLRWC